MPPRRKAQHAALHVPRTSARLASAAGARKEKETKQTSPLIEDGSSSVPPAKTSGRAGGEQAARFHAPREGLLNLPLDILMEIFILLHPRDLLALGRASRDFRAYLMSRRSAPCWKAARQQLPDLPDCPSDMSEPRYVQLVFTEECHICGKDKDVLTSWNLRIRLCLQCAKGRLLKARRVDALIKKVHQAAECTDPVLQHDYLIRFALENVYLLDDFQALQSRWSSATSKRDKVRVAKEQIEMCATRNEFVDAMMAWHVAERRRQEVEVAALRSKRLEQITERLRDEGWSKDLQDMQNGQHSHLKIHSHVYSGSLLTDEEWHVIRHDLNRFMESLRGRRLGGAWEDELARRLSVLCTTLSAHEADQGGRRDALSDTQAAVADLALDPVFRKVVYAPISVKITADDFTTLLATIPALKAEWREERAREFRALVRPASDTREPASDAASAADVDPLALAIATFDCIVCKRKDIRWPGVLAHRCARRLVSTDHQYDRLLSDLCATRDLPAPWGVTCKIYKVNANLHKQCAIIRACGLDPQRATYEDMERCAARLFCNVCAIPAVGYLEAYDWKAAVKHERPRCGGLFGPSLDAVDNKWQLLDPEHTTAVLATEAALRAKAGPRRHPDAFGCARCSFRSEKKPPLEHCAQLHGVFHPMLDVDYYVHLDSTASTEQAVKGPESILIYPEYARTDRVAAKDVTEGRAFFSAALFQHT